MGCKQLQFIDYLEFTPSGETPTSLHEVSNLDFPQEKINDANKNVTEVISNDGQIMAHYEYSPFGKVTVSSGSYASDNPYRFSSEVADDETGLVYYNYRYYSAELGRWLSRDPIEEKGFYRITIALTKGINLNTKDYNLYSIVSNKIIATFDKLGLRSFGLGCAIKTVPCTTTQCAACSAGCLARGGALPVVATCLPTWQIVLFGKVCFTKSPTCSCKEKCPLFVGHPDPTVGGGWICKYRCTSGIVSKRFWIPCPPAWNIEFANFTL